MYRAIRPLVVFGVTSGITLSAFLWAGKWELWGGAPTQIAFAIDGYDLAALELLEPTLYHVEENYVEPQRVDFELMYVEALEAVERRVPVCTFRRQKGGSALSLEVGDYRTVLEVPPITDRKALQTQLERVAAIVKDHLDPTEVPLADDTNDPFAEVEYALVNGALSTLDPHSVLLPPEASKEMDVENTGEFGGLGITITERDGKLTVEYPLPATPAMEAGLMADDHIVRIDGESTINMSLDDAVSRLRGRVGDPVDIEIMRDGFVEPLKVHIVRAKIDIHPVESALLEGNIAYVSIKNFHMKVGGDLAAELTRQTREAGGELRGLVLDLRDNPGGYLTQAVEVSNLFLWEGDIVSTIDGTGKKQERKTARAAGTEPRYPIAVLVNHSSASASEIVAGALRNNERAVIIGERTFGKGSVQNLHQFFDNSKLKITISHYLTPGDRSIQSVGIPADIELVPSIIEPAETGDPEDGLRPSPDPTPNIRLFARERVRREADLDKHLDSTRTRPEEAVYHLRYRVESDDTKRRALALEDLGHDYEVQFARDVLLAAPSWQRAEVLAAAAAVVENHRRKNEASIQNGFAKSGIDWAPGPAPQEPQIGVRLDLGEDARLRAGETETVQLEITNRGEQPLYRLAAVADDNGVLEGREFFFGKLLPGETRVFPQRVSLAAGWPSEQSPVTFSFRTDDAPLTAERAHILVEGRPLPALAYRWTVVEKNGDGSVGVGDILSIRLNVENRGTGPTVEAFARIRNRAGRALDILDGTVEPGEMRTADGQPCPVEKAGIEAGTIVGSPDDPRVAAGEHPVYAVGCRRAIQPGASWEGEFRVQVKEAPEEGGELGLELTLGDADAFDHGAIVRAGFYGYFTQQENLALKLNAAPPASAMRIPPSISVTRAPPAVLEDPHTTVSGVVTDDTGIAHVMIFAMDDKAFFQGRGRQSVEKKIPFTADVELEPGLHDIAILATDVDGLKSVRSVTVYVPEPDLQARVEEGGEAPDDVKTP